jgi:hypothetical protein
MSRGMRRRGSDCGGRVNVKGVGVRDEQRVASGLTKCGKEDGVKSFTRPRPRLCCICYASSSIKRATKNLGGASHRIYVVR